MTNLQKHLFILEGNGSLVNLGCEAILRSTVSILRREFGSCSFLNAPGTSVQPDNFHESDTCIQHVLRPSRPKWSKRWIIYQLQRSVFRKWSFEFQKYLPDSAATLALGGDTFSLDYGIETLQRRFAANALTLKSRKPLILWGVSVGPFGANGHIEKKAVKEFQRVTLICARESDTVEYLAKIGVVSNVRKMADPAFVLEPSVAALNKEEEIILREPCLGLNLSPLLGRFWKGSGSWFECAVNCITRFVSAAQMPVVLVPHVCGGADDDYVFMRNIHNELGNLRNRIVMIQPTHNAQQMKWIISRLKAFVGSRSHATIAALSSFIPTLCVGYSIKAKGFNRDIFNHYNWLIALDSLCPESLIEKTKELLAAASKLTHHLSETIPPYQQTAWSAAKYVREAINMNSRGM